MALGAEPGEEEELSEGQETKKEDWRLETRNGDGNGDMQTFKKCDCELEWVETGSECVVEEEEMSPVPVLFLSRVTVSISKVENKEGDAGFIGKG